MDGPEKKLKKEISKKQQQRYRNNDYYYYKSRDGYLLPARPAYLLHLAFRRNHKVGNPRPDDHNEHKYCKDNKIKLLQILVYKKHAQ